MRFYLRNGSLYFAGKGVDGKPRWIAVQQHAMRFATKEIAQQLVTELGISNVTVEET